MTYSISPKLLMGAVILYLNVFSDSFLLFNVYVNDPEPHFSVASVDMAQKTVEIEVEKQFVMDHRNGLFALGASDETSVSIYDSDLNVLYTFNSPIIWNLRIINDSLFVYIGAGKTLFLYNCKTDTKILIDSNIVTSISPSVSSKQDKVAYLKTVGEFETSEPHPLKIFSIKDLSITTINDSANCYVDNATILDWHPNDSLLLFGKYREGRDRLSVDIINVYTKSIKEIFYYPAQRPYGAQFSPSGSKIIFTTFDEVPLAYRIYVADTSGSFNLLMGTTWPKPAISRGFCYDENHSLLIYAGDDLDTNGIIGVLDHTDSSIDTILPKTTTFFTNAYFVVDHNPDPTGIDTERRLFVANKVLSLKSSPNPFWDNTTIYFNREIGRSSRLVIYDLQGKLIKEFSKLGGNKVMWKTKERPNGIYTARLVNGTQIYTTELILLR